MNYTICHDWLINGSLSKIWYCPYEEVLKFSGLNLFWPLLSIIVLTTIYLKTKNTAVISLMALILFIEFAHFGITFFAGFESGFIIVTLVLLALVIWWFFVGRRNL